MKLPIKSATSMAAVFVCCVTFGDAFVGPTTRQNGCSCATSTPTTTLNGFFGLGSDEKNTSTLSKSSKSDALLEKAKDFLYNKSGFYSPYDLDVFSEEFVFRGPYIGPLNTKDYCSTMDAFGVYKAIPDIDPNAWGFSIDPNDSNRVWFMVRNTGTFNGEPILTDSINYKPTGAKLDGCPETFSITFDDNQKVKYLSVGYVADRFEGNTNGKGAAIGILMAVGFPFPKVGPVQRFAQWFGTEVLDMNAKSYSTENVPKWWTDKSKSIGSEDYL